MTDLMLDTVSFIALQKEYSIHDRITLISIVLSAPRVTKEKSQLESRSNILVRKQRDE